MLVSQVAWSQIIGKRAYQQDHAAVISWPNGFKLLLLADGMGGHVGGDVASHLVIDVFKQHFISSAKNDMRERLLNSLEAANLAVFNHVNANPDHSGMGTTLVALAYDGTSIQWLSVGDSPMWLIRKNQIERINANHSMAEILAQQVERGEITAEQARTSPKRSQLLEAVMGKDIELVDAPHSSLSLQEGDCIIISSDGVETCSEQTILELTTRHANDTVDLVTEVLNAVEQAERPKQDNATIVAMTLGQHSPSEPITVEPCVSTPVEEPSTQT